jgi:hypothetical protein
MEKLKTITRNLENDQNSLSRMILNKVLWGMGNLGKMPQCRNPKKADSPGNFSEKILNFIGALIWIIVGLNLIITFLIYKLFF